MTIKISKIQHVKFTPFEPYNVVEYFIKFYIGESMEDLAHYGMEKSLFMKVVYLNLQSTIPGNNSLLQF